MKKKGPLLDSDLRTCSFKITDRQEGSQDGAMEDKAEAIKGVSPLSSDDFTHITSW